jgi:toxin ParE1/3/4
LAGCRSSRRAEADQLNIGNYTLRNWGEHQAIRYIGDLEACCQVLADNPALGRTCQQVRSGLRRMDSGRHVVFYPQDRRGILISRILHQRMLPDRHLIDDDEEPS